MTPTLEQVQAAYKATGMTPQPFHTIPLHDGPGLTLGCCAVGALYLERFLEPIDNLGVACDLLGINPAFGYGFDDGLTNRPYFVTEDDPDSYNAGRAIGLALRPKQ